MMMLNGRSSGRPKPKCVKVYDGFSLISESRTGYLSFPELLGAFTGEFGVPVSK